MRKNEHPRCGCAQCVRGARSAAGQYVHRAVNRKIRHNAKQALRRNPSETPDTVVSTPYTD